MARKNSAFWLLVLAGVMMLALIVGMDLLVDVDPSVPAIMAVRRQAVKLFPNSTLGHRFEPPIKIEIKKGEKRTRGLVLAIVVSKEVQADPIQSEAMLKDAIKLLHSSISFDDTLDRVISWYQVDVYPADLPVDQRQTPLISRRFEHTQRSSTFNRSPRLQPARGPDDDKQK